MSTESVSILLFVILFTIDLVVPVGMVVLAARQNFRHRRSNRGEIQSWAATVGYVAILAIAAILPVSVTIHPQPEGYSYLFGLGALILIALPLSAVPSIVTIWLALSLGATVHPVVMGSFTIWLVVGIMSWALLNAVGLRWLIQIGSRKRARKAAQQRPVETVAETT